MTLSVAYADEFVVRSFTLAETDLSALRYERKDANDEACAIIKVRTDLRDLAFDAGKYLVGDIQLKSGEFWLYVSPGEKRITIYKDGFITKHIPLNLPVESSKVYVLEVTNKQKATAATGSLILFTDPPGAMVKIRELSGLEFTTPDTLKNYPAFPYSVTITKFRHATLDTILTVHPGEMIAHHITLTPGWGDVLIAVEPEDTRIFINNKFVGTGDQNFVGDAKGVDVGRHTISIRHDNYYEQEQQIEVFPGERTNLKYKLDPMLGILKVETPMGAILHINSKMAGRVPYTDTLLTGNYQITLSAEGYLEVTKTIIITENNITYVNEELQHSRLVSITSKPAQAEIYLDGNLVGVTPATILMGYGANQLLLRKAKYHDLHENVQVGKDTDALHFSLKPDLLAVTVSTNPAGAQLYVDGKNRGLTNKELELPYGKYSVKVYKQGYFTRQRNVEVIKSGQTVNFDLRSSDHYRLGIMYGLDDSWGGEFTWARSSVGIGVGGYSPSAEEFSQTVQHQNVDVSHYSDLSLSAPAGKESNADSVDFFFSLKLHFFLSKLPGLSIVAGTTIGKVYYSDVYLAGEDYSHKYYGDKILKGDYFSVAHKGKWKLNPIVGVSLRLLRYFYVSGEVWFNTEHGTQFLTAGGMCFPLK
ncbi:MAG TPA: PEGA domain-containing protein [Bacteroidales bacterium]|nr:PEGA domain-containing protein [Bacteroidales bacterium]